MLTRTPRIVISEEVWKRMCAYIAACPMEVGGIGSVEARGYELHITDIFLLEQKVTSADMELDNAALNSFVSQWLADGKDPVSLRYFWHSHADMPVFWSHTDESTIQRLSKGGFFISSVGNHAGHMLTRLTVDKPFPMDVDNVPLHVRPDISEEELLAAKAEVKQKVRQPGVLSRMASILLGDNAPDITEPDAEFNDMYTDGDK